MVQWARAATFLRSTYSERWWYEVSRAKRIREESVMVVVSPITGRDYEITKVLFEDILVELGEMPMDLYGEDKDAPKDEELTEEQKQERELLREQARKDQLKYLMGNLSKIKGFYNACLKYGMVDPRVVDVVKDLDSEVTPAQLGADRMWLAEQIMEYSGVTGKKSSDDAEVGRV